MCTISASVLLTTPIASDDIMKKDEKSKLTQNEHMNQQMVTNVMSPIHEISFKKLADNGLDSNFAVAILTSEVVMNTANKAKTEMLPINDPVSRTTVVMIPQLINQMRFYQTKNCIQLQHQPTLYLTLLKNWLKFLQPVIIQLM